MEIPSNETERTAALLKDLKEGEMHEPKSPAVKMYFGLLVFKSSMKTVTLANKAGVTYVEWTTEELKAAIHSLLDKDKS